LRRADESRSNLMNKLKEGRGNLMDRVEKLRQLGARTKKKLEGSAESQEETPPN
jgi:DNA anti-recombination protein RmuC